MFIINHTLYFTRGTARIRLSRLNKRIINEQSLSGTFIINHGQLGLASNTCRVLNYVQYLLLINKNGYSFYFAYKLLNG